MSLRLRFWFAVMDACHALGGHVGSRRFALYLWALGKASDATDWGEPITIEVDDEERPF